MQSRHNYFVFCWAHYFFVIYLLCVKVASLLVINFSHLPIICRALLCLFVSFLLFSVRHFQWRRNRGFKRFNEPGPPSSWDPSSGATEKF